MNSNDKIPDLILFWFCKPILPFQLPEDTKSQVKIVGGKSFREIILKGRRFRSLLPLACYRNLSTLLDLKHGQGLFWTWQVGNLRLLLFLQGLNISIVHLTFNISLKWRLKDVAQWKSSKIAVWSFQTTWFPRQYFVR